MQRFYFRVLELHVTKTYTPPQDCHIHHYSPALTARAGPLHRITLSRAGPLHRITLWHQY